MIKAKKIGAVALKVSDQNNSLSWYNKHFGFEKLYDVEGGIVIGLDGVEIVLSPTDSPNAKLADPSKDLCIHTIGFEVSEADLLKIRAEFPEDKGIVKIDHPNFKSYIVEDVDGHCIELYCDKVT